MSNRNDGAGRGTVVSINLSKKKHVPKEPVDEAEFRADWGIVGDAHAGPGDRQVSLLAEETVERVNQMLASLAGDGHPATCPKRGEELGPGAFAENLTTRNVAFSRLVLGTRLTLGDEVVVEVSKIGKECHRHCAIYKRLGDCPMPREGLFVSVLKGGKLRPGDEVRIHERGNSDR